MKAKRKRHSAAFKAKVGFEALVGLKAVSVALSREQYEALAEAIDNWRQAQEILQRMQALSRQVIFETLPSPPGRKGLGKKVLGLI